MLSGPALTLGKPTSPTSAMIFSSSISERWSPCWPGRYVLGCTYAVNNRATTHIKTAGQGYVS
jgi:hypothetical protein